MYKDKDKQREAQREWVRQKRATKGSTKQGSTAPSVQCGVMTNSAEPPLKRGKDIKCFADLPLDAQQTANRMKEDGVYSFLPVTGKPGDDDYNGICTPEWIKERKGAAL